MKHLAVLIVALHAAGQVTANSGKVDFTRDVRPILSANCFACHGPDASQRKADLRLDMREGATADLEGKRAIVPGHPESSELIKRLVTSEKHLRMPPAKTGKSLTDAQLATLKRWIKEGGEYTAHWAFTPPRRVSPPPARGELAGWPRNPIDHFILSRLEKEGLRPSPEADRITLLRRVTLDLTGLPPTAREVDSFLADHSAEAYEKAVDRLLASPRYGERMAVDWLDAARYADSNGYQVDRDREMWPWRDWVVRAFNRNLTFDQFTIEQIAGDLLPKPTLDQRIATGLHRNHMLNEEGGVIPEEFLVEYVADRVETTATIWLGLTLGCARCHDHRFDPFTQQDFYGLYAFFHNVPESGLGNFGAAPNRSAPPLLSLAGPEHQAQRDKLAAAIARIDKELVSAGPNLIREQAEWEKTILASKSAQWTALDASELKSLGGAFVNKVTDRAIVVAGPNPPKDTYVVAGPASTSSITAFRLETLADEGLSGKGPGRSINGNIVLTEVRLAIDGKPVRIKSASADFSQQNFPIAHAIDGNPQTGWAIHPEVGKPHMAVFELAEPIKSAGRVEVTLDFQSPHVQHQLGKFRLSLTDAANPHDGKLLPAPITDLLHLAAVKRTPKQRAILEDYYRKNVSGTIRLMNEDKVRLQKELTELDARVPTIMVMDEMPKPRDTFILVRGQYHKKGKKVEAATPAVLPPLAATLPHNRLGLAKWLVDPANPLTARVAVNRYWQSYFGNGLVRTPEDFGSQGQLPSHPELLDWLAMEFMEGRGASSVERGDRGAWNVERGAKEHAPNAPRATHHAPRKWDIKAMQKLIVTSATYRQSSRLTPVLRERDPENRLLARGARHRLPAEVIRDQALAASGLLVEKLGGPPVKPYHPPNLYEQVVSAYAGNNSYQQGKGSDLYRRSMYTYWKRSVPHPAILAFDAPFREACTVRRARTSTPLQALNLMNDTTYVEASRSLAQRMLREGGKTAAERLSFGFRTVVARSPSDQEAKILGSRLERMLTEYRADKKGAEELLSVGESKLDASLDKSELAAYTTIANMLLNLDETITRE